jgi:hypothetical protein
MASRAEAIGLLVGKRSARGRTRLRRGPFGALREWSSKTQFGPSRSVEVARHTGARV